MSDDGSPGSALRALTTKLRHSLLDIRERALASLAFKLDNGLLNASDVGRNLPILRALLEWFNFEESSDKDKDVLEMLRRVATEDPSSVERLLELGADRFLRDLSSDGGEHLSPSIESLILFWEKGGQSGDKPKSAPASPARTSSKQASYAAAAQKAAAGAGGDASGDSEADKEEGKKAERPAKSSGTAEYNLEKKDATSDSDLKESAPPTLDAKTKELFLRNPRLAATYWRLKRQHDNLGNDASDTDRAAAMRAHVLEEAAALDRETVTRTQSGSLKLERILLAPSDEQRVFELGVRLTYADQTTLLLAALTELRESLLVDLPPQALVQRPTAIDAVISLARAVDGPTALARVTVRDADTNDMDSMVTPQQVRSAALITLRAFVESLKGALGHAADGAHKVAPPIVPKNERQAKENPSLPSSNAIATRAALSYPPPEGGLLVFSAFASVPNVVPAAANHALGDAMCTLPVAHEIALAVIPMLANASTSGDALSILEALAPLLEFSEVDGVQSDVSGDADEVEAKLRIKTTHVAHRLSSYVYAMEVALRNASVNASPDGTDDALPKGESPVFFPALAMCAVFISAAGTEVVAEAVATGGIPSRLVERLSTAAIDELLAAAVPGLRAASLAALATLGDSTSQNEVAAAEAADVGLQAAETAAKDDAEQAANRTPHDAAGLATAALPALDYLAQDESEPLAARLIATVLTSAASATAAQEFAPYDSETEMVASRNWLLRGINDVRLATKKLLAHRNPAGRRGAYAALAAAAEISLAPSDSGDGQQPDTAARAVSNAARAVMLGDDVVGEIVAGGLSDATTRVYAAKCLNCIAAGAGSSDEEASRAAVSLLPWLPWLECDLDDETAGPAVSAAAAAAVRAAPSDMWTPLEPLLRGLFHRAPRRRAAAAEGLARALGLNPDLPAPTELPRSLPESARAWIDPFGGVLRHADYSRKVGRNVGNDSSDIGDSDVPSFVDQYTQPGRPSVLSSVFEPDDVDELFQVLVGDKRLGPSVRCAAADQLCVCAADERLESEITKPANLAAVARLATTGLISEGPELDVASAALKFLAAVVSRSRTARNFFSETAETAGNGGSSFRAPYGRAVQLFPLAFHPRVSVRERLAVFVTYVAFGSVSDIAVERVSGTVGKNNTSFTVNASLSLPAVLNHQLVLPVRVVELTSEFDDGNSSATSPKIRAMLSQRREVRRLGGAAGALAALERQMMEDLLNGGSQQHKQDSQNARIADAQLRWASPASSAMMSLARLASAQSHSDAIAAATALRGVLAFGNPGAAAIVSSTWPEGASRLLTRPPRTAGDMRLWSLLTTVLAEAMRRSPTQPSEQVLQLATETVRSSGVPCIRTAQGDPHSKHRRALGRNENSLQSDAAAVKHPVAALAALGEDDGERAAASAAAACAAAKLATQTLDTAIAMAAAAGYGDCAVGSSPSDASKTAANICGTLLCDTDLVDAVLSKLVCDTDMAYGARVAGVGFLSSAARACALAAASRPADVLARFGGSDVVASDLARRSIEPLLTFVCAARLGDGSNSGGGFGPFQNASYSIDYTGVTPMGGGGLVDAGCYALDAILTASPTHVWSKIWGAIGQSFWLTRLSRDRVAARRARAWRLLAHAASPGARPTRAMLQKAWPESVSSASRVALDSTEAPSVRAAAASFIASCLSSVVAADADMESELAFENSENDLDETFRSDASERLSVSTLDVVPLLNQKHVWRGFADILLACVGKTEPHQTYVSKTAQRSLNSSVSEPTVTDPAAAAALRRGASSVLLACARLAPAVVAVALAPKPGDAPPERDPQTGRIVKGINGTVSQSYPPAFAAALASLDPAPWSLCLIAPPPEILAWAVPCVSAAEDAAAAAASVAALVGALAAGRVEDACDVELSVAPRNNIEKAEREELLLASRCFASARMACDTSCIPAMAAALAAAATALAQTPPPRSGGEVSARDGTRRAAVARACARAASGLAATLSNAPDPGGGPGATEAWSSLGDTPLACALIVDLAAGGTETPASTAPGSAGAALADAAKAACECLAAVFRSPNAASCVAAATAMRAGGGAQQNPVGARLTLSLIKLWHAQAVGTPGGTGKPGAAAFAAPHTAVASALRNVLAYSASAKRAATNAELIGTLLKVMEKSRVILSYDLNREKAVRAAEKQAAFQPGVGSGGRPQGQFGNGRPLEESNRTASAVAAVVANLGSPPKPLAMRAEVVLAECVSLIKHVLYCSPDASGAASSAAATMSQNALETAEQILPAIDVSGFSESPASLGSAAYAARLDATSKNAMSYFHKMWRYATSDPVLTHELLGACANLMASCDDAKRQAIEPVDSGDGQKPLSLADRALKLAFRNTSPASTTRLALAPLAALVTEPTAKRWLLRSSFLTSVVDAIETAVGRRDHTRLVSLLRAAADVAGGGGEDGRREVLRVGGSALVQLLLETLAQAGLGGGKDNSHDDDEDDVDVILAGVAASGVDDAVFRPQLPAAALEALLLLRNVCFHSEAKAHVSSNPRCLDALVAAAGAVDPGARAAAADALLALVHNGQRVSAALRSGRRPAKLRRAAGRAYRAANKVTQTNGDLLPTGEPADNAGSSQRADAAQHASKCLAALVAVLGVGGGEDFQQDSPDSTLVDIDDLDGIAEEMSDGLAIGPHWVY